MNQVIAMADYDQVHISGTAFLAGTISASLVNDFVPSILAEFHVLQAATVTGAFSGDCTIAINNSLHFEVIYEPTEVLLLTRTSVTPRLRARIENGNLLIYWDAIIGASAYNFYSMDSMSGTETYIGQTTENDVDLSAELSDNRWFYRVHAVFPERSHRPGEQQQTAQFDGQSVETSGD